MVVTPTCCTAKESKICINEFEQWGLERLHIVHLEMTKVKKISKKDIDNGALFRRDVVYFGIDEYGDSLLTYYKVTWSTVFSSIIYYIIIILIIFLSALMVIVWRSTT